MGSLGLRMRLQPQPYDDADDLDEATQQLRDVLLDLEVDAVRPLEDPAVPLDAKGVAALAGWLAVQMGGFAGIRAIIAAIREWAGRSNRQVEVTIDGDTLKVSGISSAQQDKLINDWLDRHAPGS